MSETGKKKSNEELAQDRTKLARTRNSLAQNRTLQAAERTYAAWIRTGFTLAGAGWTLGQALQSSEGRNFVMVLGGALIILGLMCFVYAWFGFKAVFEYLKRTSKTGEKKRVSIHDELSHRHGFVGGFVCDLRSGVCDVNFLKKNPIEKIDRGNADRVAKQLFFFVFFLNRLNFKEKFKFA